MNRMDVEKIANELYDYAYDFGLSTHLSVAGTGSHYLTVGDKLTIRVADHADCYGNDDLTIDGYTDTKTEAKKAIRALAKENGLITKGPYYAMIRQPKIFGEGFFELKSAYDTKKARDAAIAKFGGRAITKAEAKKHI